MHLTEAWERINKNLLIYAKKEQIITGTDFRLDSTVCECNIHYPTDSSLLWDCYRVVSRNLRVIMETSPELSKGFRFHEKKIKQLHTLWKMLVTGKKRSTPMESEKKIDEQNKSMNVNTVSRLKVHKSSVLVAKARFLS